jgi:hypothetical protein
MTNEQASKLKVGDYCLCINNLHREEWFTVGKIYKTTDFRGPWNFHGTYIDFIDNDGCVRGLFSHQIAPINTKLGRLLYE